MFSFELGLGVPLVLHFVTLQQHPGWQNPEYSHHQPTTLRDTLNRGFECKFSSKTCWQTSWETRKQTETHIPKSHIWLTAWKRQWILVSDAIQQAKCHKMWSIFTHSSQDVLIEALRDHPILHMLFKNTGKPNRGRLVPSGKYHTVFYGTGVKYWMVS